jgi:hypothetical protein
MTLKCATRQLEPLPVTVTVVDSNGVGSKLPGGNWNGVSVGRKSGDVTALTLVALLAHSIASAGSLRGPSWIAIRDCRRTKDSSCFIYAFLSSFTVERTESCRGLQQNARSPVRRL